MISSSRLTAPRARLGRTTCLLLALLLWVGATTSARAATEALDRDAFLKAIAEVETGGNARAVGRRGERGMYQFRLATWRQHTNQAFYSAHNPATSYNVAVKHFQWLHDGLVRNGREPTPYLMAAAWNAGLTRALGGTLPRSTRDYASRVTNLASVFAPRPAPGAQPALVIATLN
jgi:soluble lytic murein transglycosylase-like protein